MHVAFLIVVISAIPECYCAFKTTVISVKKCENPDPPLNENSPMTSEIELYKKNGRPLLRGNLSMTQDDTTALMNFKVGVEKLGKLDWFMQYKKISCKNILAKTLLEQVKWKYDPKTCKMFKGNYPFEDMDVNMIDHVANFVPVRHAGNNVLFVDIYNPGGTYFCIEARIEIQTLRNNNKPKKKSNP